MRVARRLRTNEMIAELIVLCGIRYGNIRCAVD